MNLCKILRIQNKFQRNLISDDIENILNKCDIIAKREYSEQKEAKESHDCICPKCRAGSDFIVDKIAQVYGNGDINSSLFLGNGKITGTFHIDTNEINHCNQCGNEWKKYKVKSITKIDILRVALRYLSQITYDPKQSKFEWKLDVVNVFNDSFTETIISLYKQHHKYFNEILRKKDVSKQYKSIYDVTEC